MPHVGARCRRAGPHAERADCGRAVEPDAARCRRRQDFREVVAEPRRARPRSRASGCEPRRTVLRPRRLARAATGSHAAGPTTTRCRRRRPRYEHAVRGRRAEPRRSRGAAASYGKSIRHRLHRRCSCIGRRLAWPGWQRDAIARHRAAASASLVRGAEPRRRSARHSTPSAAEDHRPPRPAATQPSGAACAVGAARRAVRGRSGRSAGQALRRLGDLAHRDAFAAARAARPSSRSAPTSRSPSARSP